MVASTDMSSLGQEVMPASLREYIYIFICDYIYFNIFTDIYIYMQCWKYIDMIRER